MMDTAALPASAGSGAEARRSGSARIAIAVSIALPVAAALASLVMGEGGWNAELAATVRVPRLIAALGVGALLAQAGLALQIVLRNPLADPYVLGTSGGASVGALLALALGVGSMAAGAGVGALISVALLLGLARGEAAMGADDAPRLVLLGAMLAALLGALATLLLTLLPDRELRGAVFWLVGDLSGATSVWPAPLLALALGLALRGQARPLDRLMLGGEAAHGLGEPVRRLRWGLVLGAALATATAVSTAGAIGFVGLVAPQALRLAGVMRVATLGWTSALLGAGLLAVADLVARRIAAPLELPVGALMALIGAPMFIVLLTRAPGRST